jgi:hypothetical protein
MPIRPSEDDPCDRKALGFIGARPLARSVCPVASHSGVRIERMLAKIEATLVPPPRKWLRVIIHEGDDDEAEAKEKAVAEHVACHPEDVGRTVQDFRWIVWEIVHRAQFVEDTDLSEVEFEDTDGPSETLEPIDLPPPEPGCLARSKPWRPVHQRPARDQRRPTWKKWER